MSDRIALNIPSMDEILEKNDVSIRNVKYINDEMHSVSGVKKKVCTVTYGCQMNSVNTIK